MSDASAIPRSWSGPGIIQSFIALPETSKLKQETLEKWFDEVYVPALIETGAVKSAWRFKAANPEYDKQHMVIYKCPDLALVKAGKLESVPRTSDLFPTEEPVDVLIDSESRILSFVQLYETAKQSEGS